MVSNGYKEAIDDYMNLLQGKEEPNEDEMFKLVSSFKKVSVPLYFIPYFTLNSSSL